MNRITRRRFFGTSLAAVGAIAVRRRSHGATLPTPGSTRLDQFDYGDVHLLEGPMLEQFRANHAFYLALNEDSLLQPFRQKAGLPAPGEPMGGWYSWSKDFDPSHNMTGYIPGHTFGQYMSGLARAYAATGDDATRQKIFRMVSGYAPTITSKVLRRLSAAVLHVGQNGVRAHRRAPLCESPERARGARRCD
jgi:hypothetical protein